MIKKWIQNILCFLGFHKVGKTHGIYQVGKCDNCGVEDMFF